MKTFYRILIGVFIAINLMAIYEIGLGALIHFYKHWFIAIFGVVLWCFGLFRIAKNKADEKKEHFNFEVYKEQTWDDWVWTGIWSLPIVWYMNDLIALLAKYWELPAYDFYYLGAGPVSIGAGYGMNWLINKFS